MTAYYNENDPYAAQWLRNLIAAGHIAPGDVDERSIEDVTGDDIRRYSQCHFFAGIGVWSYSARCAGWSDNRALWSGSCPCQPFSAAGKGAGFDDERHLWPAWFHLIGECEPPVIFGEQVAGKNGFAWLDLVQADMEGLGYACGAVPAPAAGFGAPHIRERLYWMVYADKQVQSGRGVQRSAEGAGSGQGAPCERSAGLRSADELVGLADAEDNNGEIPVQPGRSQQARTELGGRCGLSERPGPVNGFWRDSDWLLCTDGKWRPVEPGTFPLADGTANRVDKLRTYGNAICAPQATAFIKVAMQVAP